MSDYELVRVRLQDGTETNLGRSFAETTDGVEVLKDEPTHRDDGQLREPTRNGRPSKPKTSVAAKAAEKKATTATNEKE